LERVVRRALAKDPDQRFQTARDLKAALTWAMEQPAPAVVAKPARSWQWIAAATLLIGAFGGWALSHFRQPVTEDQVLRLQIDPPEGGQFVFGTSLGGFALSPDGRTTAYVASGNGKTGLWIRPLDGTTARLVAEGAATPFWSPDSKSLGFFTLSQLKRVDAAGGTPSVICNIENFSRGGAWTSDGRILFGTVYSGLLQVPAAGGTPVPLTRLDASRGEGWHRWPQAIPGGRFLYHVQSAKPENTGIYAASLAKPGERVRLLPTETNAVYAPGGDGKDYLLWMRGATLVAQEFNAGTLQLAGEPRLVADPVAASGLSGLTNVAASARGVLLYSASYTLSQLTWFDRAGRSAGVVGEPGVYTSFRLSPDGRRIAVNGGRAGEADLWLLEVERRGFGRLTFNSGTNINPVWSPDGGAIVFSSGYPWNLFRTESNGAGSRTEPAANSALPSPVRFNSPPTGRGTGAGSCTLRSLLITVATCGFFP
jgi:Tol biopolymer transport system component